MDIQEIKMIKSIRVCWSECSEDFYCNAELRIDGYAIKLDDAHFPTIDEAVKDIKNRVSEAVMKFKEK